MASTAPIQTEDCLLSVLHRSFPEALASVPKSVEAVGVVEDANLAVSGLSADIYPHFTYSEVERSEIEQGLTTSARIIAASGDESKQNDLLASLNDHLASRSTVLGSKPSVADVASYARLRSIVQRWTPEQRTGQKGYRYIVRHIDYVQNAPLFALKVPHSDKIDIDLNDVKWIQKPLDPKEEKEKKRKAVALAFDGKKELGKGGLAGDAEQVEAAVKVAVVGGSAKVIEKAQKKEKKEKQSKPQKQPAKEKPLSPSLIDLRVGHILKAINHPNADSLYVSTIACGDSVGTDNTSEYEGQIVRTVCSGLNGLVPLEEMQGRKIVAVCNLKPVTMRGVKSAAMVLAASPRAAEDATENPHNGPVELVDPPSDAKAGDRLFFEGWEGEPEGVLNPKKKVWESIQPGFTTTEQLEVGFEVAAVPQLAGAGQVSLGKLVTKGGGVCTVKSLKGGLVR